jgi:hypothetical protein
MESKHSPVVPVNRTRTAEDTPPGGGTAASPPASPPALLSGMPAPWRLLAAFRRRWRLAAGLGLLVGAAAVLTYYLTSPLSYTATAILRVNTGNNGIAFNIPEGQKNMEVYQRSQIELVKSRLVLNAALREEEVRKLAVVREQPEPIEWLERQVQAEFTSPDSMQIRITGKDPQAVKVLVDAVRDAYIRESAPAEQKEKLVRLTKLEKLFTEFANWLRERRRAENRFNEEMLAGDPQAADRWQEFLLREQSAMQVQRLILQRELMEARLVESLRKKAEELEAEKQPQGEAGVWEQRRTALKKKLAEAEEYFAQLEQLDALLKKRLDVKDENLRQFGPDAQDLKILNDEIDLLANIVKKLAREKESQRMEDAPAPRVPAQEDSYVVKRDSQALKYGAGAGAGGFLVVVLGIALLEFVTRRVNTATDVSRALRLPSSC